MVYLTETRCYRYSVAKQRQFSGLLSREALWSAAATAAAFVSFRDDVYKSGGCATALP